MRYIKKTNKIDRTPFVNKLFKFKKKPLLTFGFLGFVTKNQQIVEGFVFLKIRVKVRKNMTKKKKQSRAKKGKFTYWLKYNPNTFFMKKSKNARMGSGKGKFVRRAFSIAANQSFLEFRYFKLNWFNTFGRFLFNRYNLLLKPYRVHYKKIGSFCFF